MSGIDAGPSTPTRATPPPAPPPSSERPGGGGGPTPPPTGALGWGLALIIAGALWLLWLAGVAVPWDLVLPAALVLVGALVLLRTRAGDSGGLIGLGVVLLVASLVVSTVPTPRAVSAGERTHEITDPADLADAYDLGAGQLTLDLSELDLGGATADVGASVGMGELVVRVPEDVEVIGDASVGLGDVDAFGRNSSGVGPTMELRDGDGPGRLVLDLEVGLGRIEVRR